MKPGLLLAVAILCVASCGQNTSNPPSGPSDGPFVIPRATEKAKAIPPLDKLEFGEFAPEGMAAVFEKITGKPMPETVKPVSGKYRVYRSLDERTMICRFYEVLFKTEPEVAASLIAQIEEHWRKTYGQNPDWRIDKSSPSKGPHQIDGIPFGSGSIYMTAYDPYVHRLENYVANIDPQSGTVYLTSAYDWDRRPASKRDEAELRELLQRADEAE